MASAPRRRFFEDTDDPKEFDWKSVIENTEMPPISPQFSMMVKLAYLENEMGRFSAAMGPMVETCRMDSDTVSDDEVLRWAHRTRFSHTAPPEWQPHLPMAGFLPPAPMPEVMRAGAIGEYGQDPRMMDALPPPLPPNEDT